MGAYMIVAHLRDSLKSKWSNFQINEGRFVDFGFVKN